MSISLHPEYQGIAIDTSPRSQIESITDGKCSDPMFCAETVPWNDGHTPGGSNATTQVSNPAALISLLIKVNYPSSKTPFITTCIMSRSYD